ncbi:hypothetical protein ACWD6N_03645 [Micromonospora sp. NPDC005163]
MGSPVIAEVEVAGRCGWCGCPQFNHRLGKKGCKDPECGCAKYEPPKGKPAAEPAVLVVDPASPVPGVVVERPDGPDLGVCVGGFEPAQPGDVDLPVEPEQPEPIDHPVPCRGCHACEPEPTDDEVADEIDRAEGAAEIEQLHAELSEIRAALGVDEATSPMEAISAVLNRAGHYRAKRDHERRRADRIDAALRDAAVELEQVRADKVRLAGQLAPRLADLDQALGEVSKLRQVNVELGRARAEADQLRRERDKAQGAYDDAIRTGTAAAANVLYRYDADQCTTDGCGSRYTVPVDHRHPLTPVTVLIVRREVPGV